MVVLLIEPQISGSAVKTRCHLANDYTPSNPSTSVGSKNVVFRLEPAAVYYTSEMWAWSGDDPGAVGAGGPQSL